MAVATIMSAYYHCSPPQIHETDQVSNFSINWAGAGVLFDVITFLVCGIIGALGAAGVIGMPLPAAFTLIGISGATVLLWIAMSIKAKKCFACGFVPLTKF